MDIERSDILLEPQGGKWPYIMFGDGYMAQVCSKVYTKNVRGEEIIRLRLIPTEELVKRYNIPLTALDTSLSIFMEYPSDSINQLSDDPAFGVYFCFLNFKGQDCPGTKFWKGNIEMRQVVLLKQLLSEAKAELSYYKEKAKKAETNQLAFFKEYIIAPANELSNQFLQQMQQQNVGPVRSV